MELDLTKYTIEEIVSFRDKCDSYIHGYTDGFDYICIVNSYGRHWREYVGNTNSLQELCYRYDGYDGIVDVYSTNPNLSHINNYGDLKYIESIEDYENWKSYESLKRTIIEVEEELERWDNRDNVPFRERPMFEPVYNHESLDDLKKKFAEYDMSFVPPKRYEYTDK